MHTPKRNVDLDEPVVGQKKTGIIHWVSDKIKSHGDIYGESVSHIRYFSQKLTLGCR